MSYLQLIYNLIIQMTHLKYNHQRISHLQNYVRDLRHRLLISEQKQVQQNLNLKNILLPCYNPQEVFIVAQTHKQANKQRKEKMNKQKSSQSSPKCFTYTKPVRDQSKAAHFSQKQSQQNIQYDLLKSENQKLKESIKNIQKLIQQKPFNVSYKNLPIVETSQPQRAHPYYIRAFITQLNLQQSLQQIYQTAKDDNFEQYACFSKQGTFHQDRCLILVKTSSYEIKRLQFSEIQPDSYEEYQTMIKFKVKNHKYATDNSLTCYIDLNEGYQKQQWKHFFKELINYYNIHHQKNKLNKYLKWKNVNDIYQKKQQIADTKQSDPEKIVMVLSSMKESHTKKNIASVDRSHLLHLKQKNLIKSAGPHFFKNLKIPEITQSVHESTEKVVKNEKQIQKPEIENQIQKNDHDEQVHHYCLTQRNTIKRAQSSSNGSIDKKKKKVHKVQSLSKIETKIMEKKELIKEFNRSNSNIFWKEQNTTRLNNYSSPSQNNSGTNQSSVIQKKSSRKQLLRPSHLKLNNNFSKLVAMQGNKKISILTQMKDEEQNQKEKIQEKQQSREMFMRPSQSKEKFNSEDNENNSEPLSPRRKMRSELFQVKIESPLRKGHSRSSSDNKMQNKAQIKKKKEALAPIHQTNHNSPKNMDKVHSALVKHSNSYYILYNEINKMDEQGISEHSQNGDQSIRQATQDDEEKKIILQQLKNGKILWKCSADGIKPHEKKLYLSRNQLQLCYCDISNYLDEKRTFIKDIQSIQYSIVGKGILKHKKDIQRPRCLIIEHHQEKKHKIWQFVLSETEPIQNFKDFVEKLSMHWKNNTFN